MKKKMNNKGFSLVELIIVIAIMLVLVGILAPQFVKYVARSRVAADVTNAQEIAQAINVATADNTAGNIKFGVADDGSGGTPLGDSNTLTAGQKVAGIDGFTSVPTSKVDKNFQWVVTWDSVNGVTKVELKSGSDNYEVYPSSSAYESKYMK